MWIVISVLLLFAAIYLFLVFPSPAGRERRSVFAGRAYAHRGLHDNIGGPWENTLPAFEAAAESGYGIEMDVRLTLDKKLVVFHDADLKRACGVDRRVRDLTYAELSAFRVFGSRLSIPLFSDVLKTVGGRVPVIVEIKPDADRLFLRECCRIAYAELKEYKGDFCIESFDPSAVRWFAVYAPSILRGQLAMARRGYGNQLSGFMRFALANLLTGVVNRPHFIAFRHGDRRFSLRMAKLLGAMSFVWTVKRQQDHDLLEKTDDGIIFEGYRPNPRF